MKIFWNINTLENQLLDQIVAILDADPRVSIVCAPHRISEAEYKKHALSRHSRFKLVLLPFYRKPRIYLIFLMLHFMINTYDLIDTKMAQSSESQALWRISRIKRIRYMVNLYGSERNILKPDYPDHERKKIVRVLQDAVFHLCNDQTLVSTSTYVSHSSSRNIPAYLLHNGIDVKRFSNLSRLRRPAEKVTIFFNHRIMEFKRPMVFFKAVSILAQFSDRFKVLLVGPRITSSPESVEVNEFIEMNDLDRYIEWIDRRVSGQEMEQLYSRSDLSVNISELVVPSLSSLEAMAAGLPLIASEAIDTEKYVKDNWNGFIVEPKPEVVAKKLMELVTNPEKISTFSSNCIKHVMENFDMKTWAARYTQIYQTLLSTKA